MFPINSPHSPTISNHSAMPCKQFLVPHPQALYPHMAMLPTHYQHGLAVEISQLPSVFPSVLRKAMRSTRLCLEQATTSTT